MQDSHTPAPSDETAAADRDRLWLVGATALGLDERLAGRLDGHLARFAEHLREGCWPPRSRSAWRSWPS
jgi:hypothetical protein